MKRILVLGAGQSAPYLIRYLLDQADDDGWIVTVGDLPGTKPGWSQPSRVPIW
jgi:hypothetical protein